MLIRVRNQEKCDGTSALTSNLPGFSSLFAISHQTYLYFFPNLASPSTEFILSLAEGLRTCFAPLREANSSPFSRTKYAKTANVVYLLTRTMQRKPRWHVDVSMGWGMRAAGR